MNARRSPASGSVVRKAVKRVLPGFLETKESQTWKEPFVFVQAADTQLGMIDKKNGSKYPNITWDRELELCRQSVQALNAMRPRPAFFIVCGDMLDAFPEVADVRRRQEEDFMSVYSELDPEIPLLCVCGNHDIGDQPTKENIEKYTDSFGDDYFSFWFQGVQFITLNSQYFQDCSLTKDLAAEQDKWLEKQLAKKAKHKVMFQHIPWFLEKPGEAKEYFNLWPDIRRKCLNKFKKAGVSKIFCGHYHRNAGGWDGDLELVITSAIGCQVGDDPHGMRLVEVMKSGIKHQYYGLDDFPTNIILSKI